MKFTFITSAFLFFIHLQMFSQVQEVVFPIKHVAGLTSLSYSADKTYIATSSDDRTCKLWYSPKCLLLRTYVGHKGNVTCTEVSQDLKMIVTGSADSTFIIWNVNNVNSISGPHFLGGKVTSVCFIPSGQSIIAGTDNGRIIEWNISSGKIINDITYNNCKITKLSFSKDSNRFLASISKQQGKESGNYPGSLLLFDLKSFNKPFPISNYKEDVTYFCKSPDSTKIITSASNGMVRVWDAENFMEIISFKNNNLVPGIVFASRNGKMIGVAGQTNNNVNIWRITGEKLFDFQSDQSKVIFAEFSEDNTKMNICTDFGKFRVYDLNAREREKLGDFLNSNSMVTTFSVSPLSGKFIMGYKSGMIKGFDLQANQTVKITTPQSTKTLATAFSNDGKKLFVSNDQTVIYDEVSANTKVGDSFLSFIETATGTRTKLVSVKNEYATSITGIGKYIVAGFNSGQFRTYDYLTGTQLNAIQGHDYDILDLQVSSDWKMLFSGSMDASLKIWKIDGFKLILQQTLNFKSDVTHLRYCNLSKNMMVSTKDNGLQFIRNIKQENIEIIPLSHEVTGIEVSEKDSVFFVSYKSGITECAAFSSVDAKKLWIFSKTGPKIVDLKYLQIYNAVLCCLENGSVIFLDAVTGKEKLTLLIFDNDEWLAYTPENKFDGSANTVFNVNIIENLTYTDRSQIDNFHQVGLLKSVLVNK